MKRQVGWSFGQPGRGAVVVAGGVTASDQLAGVFISLPGLKRRVFISRVFDE
jgi:hypothetical protein